MTLQAVGSIEGRPITPNGFAREFVQVASCDPGCEVKAMLFRTTDGEYLKFAGFECGGRCLVLILKKER